MGAVLILLLAVLAAGLYRLSKVGMRFKGYPPGPPTLPLIGNLHLMPKEKPHLQLEKWAREYGPVYSLMLGTQCMIVLSSDQAVKDLLDKRSNIYSSRPDLYMGQIISNSQRMLLMKYGDTWRTIRKMVHNILHIKAAKSYVPYQDLENKQMIVGLLDEPDLFYGHLRRYANSLTSQMIFGVRTLSLKDPKMVQLFDSFEEFSKIMGKTSAALLDVFPVLRLLPDALLPMRRYAKQLHKRESKLYYSHYQSAKEKIKKGTAMPCFCVDLVKGQEAYGLSDGVAAYTAGSLLEAGSDTTSSTLIGFVQAMVLHPEVQKKAQEELDRVCDDQLPTMEDYPNLPYIRGCIKESARWMPTGILGVPHACIKDDEYMGYTIPKGASVMWNVWAIHMDPNRHPEPRRFNPDRYAGDNQTAAEAASNPDATKRDHFLFGAGRRVCQGMHIAERSLFLGISRMLWGFEFRPKKDEAGRDILPDPNNLTEGMLVVPRPFGVDIIPRSEKHERMMREEWEKAQEVLNEEKQWKKVPDGMVFSTYTRG